MSNEQFMFRLLVFVSVMSAVTFMFSQMTIRELKSELSEYHSAICFPPHAHGY